MCPKTTHKMIVYLQHCCCLYMLLSSLHSYHWDHSGTAGNRNVCPSPCITGTHQMASYLGNTQYNITSVIMKHCELIVVRKVLWWLIEYCETFNMFRERAHFLPWSGAFYIDWPSFNINTVNFIIKIAQNYHYIASFLITLILIIVTSYINQC